MNAEWWQVLIGFGAMLVPVVLAVMARDRAMIQMIVAIKDEARSLVKAGTEPLHERVNRVRDEYVRRDDWHADMARLDKQFDDLRLEMRQQSTKLEGWLDDIRKRLPPPRNE